MLSEGLGFLWRLCFTLMWRVFKGDSCMCPLCSPWLCTEMLFACFRTHFNHCYPPCWPWSGLRQRRCYALDLWSSWVKCATCSTTQLENFLSLRLTRETPSGCVSDWPCDAHSPRCWVLLGWTHHSSDVGCIPPKKLCLGVSHPTIPSSLLDLILLLYFQTIVGLSISHFL